MVIHKKNSWKRFKALPFYAKGINIVAKNNNYDYLIAII